MQVRFQGTAGWHKRSSAQPCSAQLWAAKAAVQAVWPIQRCVDPRSLNERKCIKEENSQLAGWQVMQQSGAAAYNGGCSAGAARYIVWSYHIRMLR